MLHTHHAQSDTRPGKRESHEGYVDVAQASRRPPIVNIIVGMVVCIAALQAAQFFATNKAFEWSVVGEFLTDGTILKGILTTLELTAISMILGVMLGAVIAAMRQSKNPFLSSIAGVYVWIFRAIPLLVQLLFWYNLSALLPRLTIGVPFGPDLLYWETNSLITPMIAAILGLTLNEAAYMAEIIRGGLMAVDPAQREAATAIGMNSSRMYGRIIVPQAMRFIVPPTGSQLISMLKATSLVSVIAMSDLLYNVQHIYNENFKIIPLLTVAVIWYLVLTSVLYVGQMYVERYYARGADRNSVAKRSRRARRIIEENRVGEV